MGVLLFFVDGVGIGEYDSKINPLARFESPFFSQFINFTKSPLPYDGHIVATDVTMGVGGLPQSATGQTALLTGHNAAKIIGRHHPGFPTIRLRELLLKESIFLKIREMGKVGVFANAFTPSYFKRADRSISASTWSFKAGGFPFLWLDNDLWNEKAVSHDLTNETLNNWGYKAPIFETTKAARILAELTTQNDFCLFEYFLTDAIGHGQDMEWAKEEIEKLTRVLDSLLQCIDLTNNSVILTSDHGNFEDLSVPLHTRNAVPTLIWGAHQDTIAKGAGRIENICPALLKSL